MQRSTNPTKEMTATGMGKATTDQKLRIAAIGLAAFGLLVSLYLTWIKFNPASAFCSGVGDCEAVNTSVYSEFQGIPIAAIGAAAYAVMLGILLLEKQSALFAEWGPAAVFGLALAGTLYSAYLTYIELAVIHQICPYCVASAVAITLLLVVSSFRMRRFLE